MHVNPEISALLEKLNNPALPTIDLSLERMWKLLAQLGNPEKRLPPVIHVAGTNGKGSTIAFLRAMVEAAGYRVHTYTSPHLVRFNERIVLAGNEIDDATLLPLLQRVEQCARTIPVTFFEATTALALLAFAEHKADVVLLETGLGGRLDATNVVAQPMLTILTPIDYDHMEFLGDDLQKIAAEKAGILKPNVPCVVGAQSPEALPVIARAAYALRAPLLVCGHGWNAAVTAQGLQVILDTMQINVPLPALLGPHQLHNAALAITAVKQCEQLPVSDEAIAAAMHTVRWPARLQRLSYGPWVEAWGARGHVVLDGAHNPSAARVLAEWVVQNGEPVTMVCGMMRRKDPAAFLAPLAAHVRSFIAVPIAGQDCYTPEELAAHARASGIKTVRTCTDDANLSQIIRGEENGTLILCGSLFLAGELLKNHG